MLVYGVSDVEGRVWVGGKWEERGREGLREGEREEIPIARVRKPKPRIRPR